MYRIELLPHTADVRILLEADSVAELFQAGVQAISGIIKEGFCEDELDWIYSEKIDIQSVDQTALLIDFLSDVLTVSQTRGIIFCKVEIKKLDECNIVAVVWGGKVNEFAEDIKAITYHEAEITQNERGRWQTLVICDI